MQKKEAASEIDANREYKMKQREDLEREKQEVQNSPCGMQIYHLFIGIRIMKKCRITIRGDCLQPVLPRQANWDETSNKGHSY